MYFEENLEELERFENCNSFRLLLFYTSFFLLQFYKSDLKNHFIFFFVEFNVDG